MPFPPYQLLDRDYVERARGKLARLERLYHVGQDRAWDGRAVLTDLLRKHDGVHLPDDKRASIAKIFSIILWGELAAWTVAAELAEGLDDIEARMAATSQAHDEARHFYVMRDYLLALGGEMPKLDGYSATTLRLILDSTSLPQKLVGMQLLVEQVAVNLFKMVAQAEIEPVLTELMPYFERDEARHVGLGVLYIPRLAARLSALEAARLRVFQFTCNGLLAWGTHLLREDFERLGIDMNVAVHRMLSLQRDTFAKLAEEEGGRVPAAILVESRRAREVNDRAADLFFPRLGTTAPPWQRRVLGAVGACARVGEQTLRATIGRT